MNRKIRKQRGMTSVLAMLYLVIFSTLAIGFYAATNTQSHVVSNDQRVARAFMACESGMDFMRYELGRVYIPPEPLPPDKVIEELFSDLQFQLDDTGNLGGQTIERVGNTIQIPANGGFINLDANGNSKFRATITDWAGEIVVKIDGKNGTTSASRAITMDFTRTPYTTTAFDHAVSSKGQITMKKGAVTAVSGVDPRIASMMSSMAVSDAIIVTGGTIGGDLSVVEGGDVEVTGGSVGGSSIPSVILSDHVNRDVEPPYFPEITTSVFEPYATNTYSALGGGNAVMSNLRIPAGTGTALNPLTFNGNRTIQGILYIESPNHVVFEGNLNLQGFIVFENAGDSSDNALRFAGSVLQSPLPAAEEFDKLRATSGVSILAPTTKVQMTGNTDSYLRGSLIAGKLHFGDSASADLQIDAGTLMTYDETPDSAVFSGGEIRFTATGQSNIPTTGLSYETYYDPKPATYQEVSP